MVKVDLAPAIRKHPKIPHTRREIIQWSFLLDMGEISFATVSLLFLSLSWP